MSVRKGLRMRQQKPERIIHTFKHEGVRHRVFVDTRGQVQTQALTPGGLWVGCVDPHSHARFHQ